MFKANLDIPPVLYKYRDIDEYSLNILRKCEVYLPSATKLNDPFDCGIVQTTTFNQKNIATLSGPDLIDYLEYYFDSNNVIFDTHLEKLQFIQKFIHYNEEAKKDDKLLTKVHEKSKQIAEHHRNNTGVYSLSSNPLSSVMWAHYANNHEGFCVGFDPTDLQNALKGFYPFKVIYNDEIPTLELTDDTETKSRKSLGTKFKEWSFESEYRIVNSVISNKELYINNTGIKSVLLGANMLLENKKTILDIIHKNLPSCEVYQVEIGINSLQLRLIS